MKHSNDLTSNDEAKYKSQHKILMMDHKMIYSHLIRKESVQIVVKEKTCTLSHCGSLSRNLEQLEKWRNELITDLETATNKSSLSQDIHTGVLELVTKELANLNYLKKLQEADSCLDLDERRALAKDDQKHLLSISTESKVDNLYNLRLKLFF